jgi:hypothetical protein
MSHRTLSTALRVVAVLVVVAVGAGLVSQAGSQMSPPPARTGPPSLPGTLVIYFRAEDPEQRLMEMQLRTARPSFMVSGDTERPDGASFSWRFLVRVEVISNQDRIRLDLEQAVLEREKEGSRLNLSFQAGAILTSGKEKILFKNDEVTLRVTAVFEPAGD